MDGSRGSGCCIARYDGGAAIDRIMLRYRPIAPKPVAAGVEAASGCGAGAGGKRGRSGGDGRRRRRKARKVKVKGSSFEPAAITTTTLLPLMPETPERKETTPAFSGTPSPTRSGQGAVVVAPRAVRAAGAWVTVDRVTEAWGEEEVGACCSDEGVRRSLEGDACPGFLSEERERVVWLNAAFRRMVVVGGEEEEEEDDDVEVRVALVTRGLVPADTACRAFTCRVTVRYACRRRGRVMLAAPCDVWRLADGGLVWRVDVKAALSLSSVR